MIHTPFSGVCSASSNVGSIGKRDETVTTTQWFDLRKDARDDAGRAGGDSPVGQ